MGTLEGLTRLGARTYFLSVIILVVVLSSKCSSCPEPCSGDACPTAGAAGEGGDAPGGAGGETTTGTDTGGVTGGTGGTGGETGGSTTSSGGTAGSGGTTGGTGGATGGTGGETTTSSSSTTDPTCNDGIQNGTEAGVDCGGPCATGCPDGNPCSADSDCAIGVCTANTCGCPVVDHLLITEVRAAPQGGAPGFIELWNPTPNVFNESVTMWVGANQWNGNLYIDPGARYVFEGLSLKTGTISIAISGGPTLDVFCYCFDFWCNQEPAPMCNGSQVANPVPSGSAESLERRPVGANCIDTNKSGDDFVPQPVASPGF